ncbi:DUF4157 domain-containing protein [Streptomyces sp. NPDC093085]|uniref:eCIS core domain-containing protein n=1 Tax=Streptomyces sp. NPDC093085 TaxID=3155068 RepID=UPI0034449F4D
MTTSPIRNKEAERGHMPLTAREPTAGSAAQGGPDLMASAGNAAVVQMLRQAGHPWAQSRHQHGPACGHQGSGSQVQRSVPDTTVERAHQDGEHAHDGGPGAAAEAAEADHSPAAQAALLNEAIASPSRSLPTPLLDAAVPYFQNPNLGAAQLHDNPVAQRATEALGAQAMTVGHHIFAPPKVARDMRIMGHELSHVNENLNGTKETGVNSGAGFAVTDPNQGSERSADKDGAFFEAGAATAPSVVAQRAASGHAGHHHEDLPEAGTVQRAAEVPTVQRVEGSQQRGGYEADHSGSNYSSSGSEYERQPDSSPERGASIRSGGAGSAAQSFMDGPANPYQQRNYGRYEFEPSSSSSEDERRQPARPESPAPAPAPVQSSAMGDAVYGIVHSGVTSSLLEGAEAEEGGVTDESRAMIDGWAEYAASAASAAVNDSEVADHAEDSPEYGDFLYRYPMVFEEVFTEHHELLFAQQAERIADMAVSRVQREQRQNRRAARHGIDLPEHPELRPLRALLLRELLDGSRKKLKVTLKVDAGNVLRGSLGHAWIEVTGSDGKKVAFGFYPERGEEIPLLESIPGGVACPDGHKKVTHRESKNVSLNRVQSGYQVAFAKAEVAYNLTQYNCTIFANDVWKAMTGEDMPRNLLSLEGLIGTVAPNPTGAAHGLDRHQAPRLDRRRERLRPAMEGPMRGLVPGTGNADEMADQMARMGISQSSGQSSDEVD